MSRNRYTLGWTAALALSLSIASCKKDDVDLKDPVPQILGVTVNPNNVVEYQDSIVFSVSYRDGDGDLGENSPDAKNLFLTDNRIGITEQYRIRELAPQGAEIPITGTLRVVLPSTGITNGATSENVTYTIYIKDRAGNQSNSVESGTITVHQ